VGQLSFPLGNVAAETVQENQRPFGALGGDVDDGDVNGWVFREHELVPIQLDIYLHGSPLALSLGGRSTRMNNYMDCGRARQ
jgi:hypothetical protein